ncbi:MAG TPA: hypothetical protein VG734_24205 [Lacunisphaera sp.]|nr:hypothetical protein [Lacunisphaera sp.]
MPDAADPSDTPLTLEERKQFLILACEADRAAWCEACRPRPRPPAAVAMQLLRFLEPVLSLIPGFPGRWLRRAGFIARVVRELGLFAS